MGLTGRAVRGNCDFISKQPYEQLCEAGDKKLFITHGHLFDVKMTTKALMRAGAEQEADIILFGHTHERLCEYVDDPEYEKPFYLVNPGSISMPHDGIPTYALIEIRDGDILINIAHVYS